MRTEPKIGTTESVKRSDGKTVIYQYMVDPSIKYSDEDTSRFNKIGWWPSRWVVTSVSK